MKEGMLCPVCKVTLAMMDRQGIEVDYCPQCRGVWLDRGELDKLIERNASVPSAPVAPPSAPRAMPSDYRPDREREYRSDERGYEPDQRDRRSSNDDDRYGREQQPRRKKGGFLSDIFDFGD